MQHNLPLELEMSLRQGDGATKNRWDWSSIAHTRRWRMYSPQVSGAEK